MEYNLDAFFNSLISYMAVAFPYMKDEELDQSKHPKRNPLHLKDAIFNNLQPIHSLNSITFDIGNDFLEQNYPYYHILEDAQVIRKRGRGTKKSKGSQDKITDAKARDYGRVNWNGKTFSQEYKKNVRGARSKLESSSRRAYIIDDQGIAIPVMANMQADYYANIHYQYIEKMLDNGIVDTLAAEFGLRRLRKQDTGLQEEYLMQESMDYGRDNASSIIDIFNSFQ